MLFAATSQVLAYRNLAVCLRSEGCLIGALQNLRCAARLARGGSKELQGVLLELGQCWLWWVEQWEDGTVRESQASGSAASQGAWLRSVWVGLLRTWRCLVSGNTSTH